jgi:hypothetical protein
MSHKRYSDDVKKKYTRSTVTIQEGLLCLLEFLFANANV